MVSRKKMKTNPVCDAESRWKLKAICCVESVRAKSTRSYLKKIFWLKLGVRPFFQILNIREYAPQGHLLRGTCGLKLGPALILNQNLFFEIASINNFKIYI